MTSKPAAHNREGGAEAIYATLAVSLDERLDGYLLRRDLELADEDLEDLRQHLRTELWLSIVTTLSFSYTDLIIKAAVWCERRRAVQQPLRRYSDDTLYPDFD